MRERVQILLLMILAVVGISQLPFAARLEENVGLDLLYRGRGAIAAPEGAAIVSIDEGSVAWLHRNSARLGSVARALAGCMGPDAAARLGGCATCPPSARRSAASSSLRPRS